MYDTRAECFCAERREFLSGDALWSRLWPLAGEGGFEGGGGIFSLLAGKLLFAVFANGDFLLYFLG